MMDPLKIDNITRLYPQKVYIGSSDVISNYKSVVKLKDNLDFLIQLETPSLDIYSTDYNLNIDEISERFYSSLISDECTASLLNSMTVYIGLAAVDINQYISIDNIDKSNFKNVFDTIINRVIDYKINGGMSNKKISYSVVSILDNIIKNIGIQSAVVLSKSHEEGTLHDYWSYTNGDFTGHFLKNGNNLLLTYHFPLRLQNNPTHTALQLSTTIIDINFGISYHMDPDKIK